MDYTKTLLRSCTDLDIDEYIIGLNNVNPYPINNGLLIDLIEILSSKKIHHLVLVKYGIISESTNIPQFLLLYSDDFIQEGYNYYFTNKVFERILTYESHMLYEHYLTILRYKRWYNIYQYKLHEVIELHSRYMRLSRMVSDIHDQYDKIETIKDGTPELDNALEKQRIDLSNMETEIKKNKKEIHNKLNKILQ